MKWILTVLMALVVVPAAGQDWYYPVNTSGRVGFIDATGQLVTGGDFDAGAAFQGSRGPVRIDHRWGFISPDGTLAIEARWLEVTDFRNDRARVRDAAGWHLIDTDGTVVTTRAYAGLRASDAGVYPFMDPATGKWGLVDSNGEEIVTATYDGAGAFSEGWVPVQVYRKFLFIKLERRWGYISRTGAWQVEPQYTSARSLSGGYALISRGGKKGAYLTAAADTSLLITYPSAFSFAGSRARVGDGEHYGFIGPDGEEVIELKFEAARDFSGDRAAVMLNGKWGYVDPGGQMMVMPRFDMASAFEGPLARVRDGDQVVYIDRNGGIVWPGMGK